MNGATLARSFRVVVIAVAAVTSEVASLLRSFGGVTSHSTHALSVSASSPHRASTYGGIPCVLSVWASASAVLLIRSARIDLWMSLF